jgi:tetratricopeptide (TPR) repeat protein
MIKEYSLGAEVFGRGDEFDPRIDPIVRVQARNLRARMARYYAGPGATETVVIDLPKRTYVPVFTAREAAPIEAPVVEAPAEAAAAAEPEPAVGTQSLAAEPPARKSPIRMVAAAMLVAVVGGALTFPMRPARAHSPGPAAQEQYIRGRFLLDRHVEAALRESVSCFDRAIAADNRFAAAWAGLADAYNLLAQNGFMPPPEGMEKARTAARKAIELEPRLAEGHVALAAVIEAYDWDWAAAEQEYRRAIDLNPSLSAAHLWYGMFLRDQGRLEQAMPELRLAAELSPVSELTSINFAYGLMETGNYSSALEQAELAAQLNPNSVSTQLLLANIYRCLARKNDALEALARAEQAAGDNPHGLSALAGAYSRYGREDKSVLLQRRLVELSHQRYVSPFDLANVSLLLGDEDRALQLYEEAYKQRSSGMIYLRGKSFANMRKSEQFLQLIHRMHFAG